MSTIRIHLEIGHEAAIRTKKTQEGFTHDWEVFVKGCDGAEIQYYVEKVVFYLHETFPKPRRVVKEPPYTVKESGYAGFNLPIDIYLRNSAEPKKIRFYYDLHLQPSGPPIFKVQKEKYIFNSPPDDFRMKLLKGGGVVGGSSISSIALHQDVSDVKTIIEDKLQMTSKPKLSGSSDVSKKHKPKLEEPRTTNSFQDLFGTPITKTSKSLFDSKPMVKDNKTSSRTEKNGSGDKKSGSKSSPHKDKDKKEKSESDKRSKDERRSKTKHKERERSKDKSIKKDKSPRPDSPKKMLPKRTSPMRVLSPQLNKHREKDARPDKDKSKSDEKKIKKDKSEKSHKHKDDEKRKESKNRMDPKALREMFIKDGEKSPTPIAKPIEKKEKPKEKPPQIKETPKLEDEMDKSAFDKMDEKMRSKYKKKSKSKKEKSEEKSHRSESKSEKIAIKTGRESSADTFTAKDVERGNLFESPNSDIYKPKEEKSSSESLNASHKLIEDESSNSGSSTFDATSTHNGNFEKKDITNQIKKPIKDTENVRKEKTKNKEKKSHKSSDRKYKRKLENDGDANDEPPEKVVKEESVFSGNSENEHNSEQTENEMEDYISVLRDLQHKIMELKNRADLQKVVKLIAETGRYEVSAHTFDFDLCLLDRATVQQLQSVLASGS